MTHAYPTELARLVRDQWNKPPEPESLIELPTYPDPDELPAQRVLDSLISIAYQASLMRDEGRQVRFRLILRDPDRFLRGAHVASGLHVLQFESPLPLEPNELRRLAPASPLERGLIGVHQGASGELEIWGLVHSGEEWLRALEGSRRTFTPLPASLVISVAAPGHVTVAQGSLTVARLLAGTLATPSPSILERSEGGDSRELDERLIQHLDLEAGKTTAPKAHIQVPLVRRIRRLVALRIASSIRRLQHGGTVLMLPPDLAADPGRCQRALQIKYSFGRGESRRRLRQLTVDLLSALAFECGARFGANYPVTWQDYLTSAEPAVVQADEAITEFANHIACFSAVDGAVVIGQPLEVLGFGAEISGQLPAVDFVGRAVDSGFTEMENESTLNVGTRHRSCYRFCQALPGTSALVVSKDGSVRFVACLDGRVVYTEHLSSGALNI